MRNKVKDHGRNKNTSEKEEGHHSISNEIFVENKYIAQFDVQFNKKKFLTI